MKLMIKSAKILCHSEAMTLVQYSFALLRMSQKVQNDKNCLVILVILYFYSALRLLKPQRNF